MTFAADAPASPDSGIFGLTVPESEARVVLLPVPFDATASYGRATAQAPEAILHASHQVDLRDLETGRPYEAGIHMLEPAPELSAWNADAAALIDAQRHAAPSPERDRALAAANAACDKMNAWVRRRSDELLAAGHLVGVVGGDHSTPFGLMAALAARHPGLGILHIDAHADLRDAYEDLTWSHASIMHNATTRLPVAKLVQVGVRDFCDGELAAIEDSRGRIVTFFDQTIAGELAAGRPFAAVAQQITDALPHDVYVSFDIDGLDPSLCPHTGTPVPGGLSFREACVLLTTLAKSGRRIVGFDLNEVAPGPDGDEWDANVGARVLYKLCGHAINTNR